MAAREVDWRRFVPILTVAAHVQVLAIWFVGQQPDQVTLRKGSHRFVRFFARWYREEGRISLYCEDLE
jgi:hypothetical protein